MRAFHILKKDLFSFLRSPFVLAFLLVLPLAQTGLPYLAFNGFSREPQIEKTRVAIANLDQPVEAYPDFSAGGLLISMFAEESLTDLAVVEEWSSAGEARSSVDVGLADAALIIPADFTRSLFETGGHVELEMYADPGSTFGPMLVQEVAINFLDGFSGAQMAATVSQSAASRRNCKWTEEIRLDVMLRYGEWAQTVGNSLRTGTHPAITYAETPSAQNSAGWMDALVGSMLMGMLVFFGFFVSCICATSFLREREQGTLARLMTTPLPTTALLLGKTGAIAAVLLIQALLLLTAGAWLFGIAWGGVIPVTLCIVGFIASASGFGTLLVSFLRSPRQATLILSGIVIVTSAAGGTFTTTFDNLPAAFETLQLFTPQGWVMQAFEHAMAGSGTLEIIPFAGISFLTGLVCMGVGCWNIRRSAQ